MSYKTQMGDSLKIAFGKININEIEKRRAEELENHYSFIRLYIYVSEVSRLIATNSWYGSIVTGAIVLAGINVGLQNDYRCVKK